MKGVLRFGSTAKMLHCESTVQESAPCGKTTPFQLRLEGPNWGWPRLIVPPKVPPAGQVPPMGTVVRQAPVGFWATLPCPPFWGPLSMNGLAKNDEYITLDAPRTTVVPLPVTSQAKPTRGEKFL